MEPTLMVNSLNTMPSHPLEALDLNINHLSYGFLTAVSSLWAWLAALTAAVSFWRMRALTPPPSPSSSSVPEVPRASDKPASRREAAESADNKPSVRQLSSSSSSSSFSTAIKTCKTTSSSRHGLLDIGEGGDSSPKVKFSVHYYQEEEEVRQYNYKERDDELGCINRKENIGNDIKFNHDYDDGRKLLRYCDDKTVLYHGDDWKRTMVVRMGGDMGWYTWQDVGMLDGNVVRFWDQARGGRS